MSCTIFHFGITNNNLESPVRQAGYLNDLRVFDAISMIWTNLTGSMYGVIPSPRRMHGLTSVGGKLYVHGGTGQGIHSTLVDRVCCYKTLMYSRVDYTFRRIRVAAIIKCIHQMFRIDLLHGDIASFEAFTSMLFPSRDIVVWQNCALYPDRPLR